VHFENTVQDTKFLILEKCVQDGVLASGCRIQTMSKTLPERFKDFTDSLEQLYETFSSYTFRPDMPCCIPHCFDQSEIEFLGSKPLCKLTAEELSSFTSSLMLTCGETPDLKYFLPRVFELAAQNAFVWPNPEIVLGKLSRAQWKDWPEDERKAVRAFLKAWWRYRLQLPDIGAGMTSFEDCLAALCCTHDDLTEYLQIWLETTELVAVEHLTAFYFAHGTTIWLGGTFNSFVEKSSVATIKRWLQSDATLSYLERAFFAHEDSSIAEAISMAHLTLSPSN
jgi:hypothetical protein